MRHEIHKLAHFNGIASVNVVTAIDSACCRQYWAWNDMCTAHELTGVTVSVHPMCAAATEEDGATLGNCPTCTPQSCACMRLVNRRLKNGGPTHETAALITWLDSGGQHLALSPDPVAAVPLQTRCGRCDRNVRCPPRKTPARKHAARLQTGISVRRREGSPFLAFVLPGEAWHVGDESAKSKHSSLTNR